MDVLQLIRQKRAGQELTEEQISWLVKAAVEGTVPQYQLSALLMALCYEHLTYSETRALTMAFVASGERLRWPPSVGTIVDKHSTGGVGDKTSLLLAPWLAAAGLSVPKMSGRGLGHTGGTIDKLESIPGFQVNLGRADMDRLLTEVGCAVVAQSTTMVPADKLFYQLRNDTDTVNEDGLIAASVMGKKLAAGAHYIVLDVKCGSGAFFKDIERARNFAQIAVRLGHDFGRRVACVITNMDQPLGTAVGNTLEVKEVLDLLEGRSQQPDLIELCVTLGAVLLVLTEGATNVEAGREIMLEQLEYGMVLERFKNWVAAQGGDLEAFRRDLGRLDGYRKVEVRAVRRGYVAAMQVEALGELLRSMGAGRYVEGDVIYPLTGLLAQKKVGSEFAEGEVLATLYARPDDPRSDQELGMALMRCYSFSESPVQRPELIHEIVGLEDYLQIAWQQGTARLGPPA
ncbi:thymidine phosphorylase [bacterium]|nr:thymidine phosphorylase [bacterium]